MKPGILSTSTKKCIDSVIEITRDKPTPPDFSNRKANVYKVLPLPQYP